MERAPCVRAARIYLHAHKGVPSETRALAKPALEASLKSAQVTAKADPRAEADLARSKDSFPRLGCLDVATAIPPPTTNATQMPLQPGDGALPGENAATRPLGARWVSHPCAPASNTSLISPFVVPMQTVVPESSLYLQLPEAT